MSSSHVLVCNFHVGYKLVAGNCELDTWQTFEGGGLGSE